MRLDDAGGPAHQGGERGPCSAPRRSLSRVSAAPRDRLRTGPLAFLAFLLLGLAWLLAVPINGAPDEREHIVRAAAVARGQVVAERGDVFIGTGGMVAVPQTFNALTLPAACCVFQPHVPASCARLQPGSQDLVRTPSGVARYFPLYYLVVGLPSDFFPSLAGIYLMRLVALVVAAGLVAMGVDALSGVEGL